MKEMCKTSKCLRAQPKLSLSAELGELDSVRIQGTRSRDGGLAILSSPPSSMNCPFCQCQRLHTPVEIAAASFSGGQTLGWSFTANVNTTVTALGVLDAHTPVASVGVAPDAFGTGLAMSHEVALWDTGTLLSSVTIPAGTAATLLNNYRYEPISPVRLDAGATYVVDAFYAEGSADTDDIILASTPFGLNIPTFSNLGGRTVVIVQQAA
jgi:hypothetical protein